MYHSSNPEPSRSAGVFERVRSRLTYANIVASLALFLALGTGGAYAANEWTGANIKNGTLTGQDIKNGSLKTIDVKDENLTGTDIKNGTVAGLDLANGGVGTGQVADGSLTGDDVADFSLSNEDVGVLFAQVNANGTVANSSGAVTAIRLGIGVYEVDFGRDITNAAFVATQGEAGIGGASGAIMGVTDRSGNAEAVFVTTRDANGAFVDTAFQLLVVN